MYLRDGQGVQNYRQYKAVPFFVSSNGYGMFVHTSAPVTFDFGHDFDQHTVIYTGDEVLDVFVFLGRPKDVVREYTALTGRSPVPPLWSFGLWMSRITYRAEAEVRDVAAKLRRFLIPSDVIHLDTGWFETEWQSNYEFAPTRFPNPRGMIADLGKMGFHISLWQYTYFTRKNKLWDEMQAGGYGVRDEGGRTSPEDATLDFSRPDAVRWYQGKLKNLLDMGVGVIKADFGEGAPLTGVYASGRTGWYEHNLYPVRYNKAVWDITRSTTGDGIIWGGALGREPAYPLLGGRRERQLGDGRDAAGGCRLGSGFTYWSHDVGGFVNRAPRELYRRWLAFGVLTSHTRAHGAPPREPWEYDSAFVIDYRRAVEMKYRLMPYIYAQARASSDSGYPLLRTLFFEYPDDPTSWLIEDEYLFGSDLLVAPLFEATDHRTVYVPPGTWIDYQTGRPYPGGAWHDIHAGPVPIIVLAKNGAVIPHIGLAQSTAQMNWNEIELRVFGTDAAPATGPFALPRGTGGGEAGGGELYRLELVPAAGGYVLVRDPLPGRVRWSIRRGSGR
jgi:alpha-D-xyloside xylohydrolase